MFVCMPIHLSVYLFVCLHSCHGHCLGAPWGSRGGLNIFEHAVCATTVLALAGCAVQSQIRWAKLNPLSRRRCRLHHLHRLRHHQHLHLQLQHLRQCRHERRSPVLLEFALYTFWPVSDAIMDTEACENCCHKIRNIYIYLIDSHTHTYTETHTHTCASREETAFRKTRAVLKALMSVHSLQCLHWVLYGFVIMQGLLGMLDCAVVMQIRFMQHAYWLSGFLDYLARIFREGHHNDRNWEVWAFDIIWSISFAEFCSSDLKLLQAPLSTTPKQEASRHGCLECKWILSRQVDFYSIYCILECMFLLYIIDTWCCSSWFYTIRCFTFKTVHSLLLFCDLHCAHLCEGAEKAQKIEFTTLCWNWTCSKVELVEFYIFTCFVQLFTFVIDNLWQFPLGDQH